MAENNKLYTSVILPEKIEQLIESERSRLAEELGFQLSKPKVVLHLLNRALGIVESESDAAA